MIEIKLIYFIFSGLTVELLDMFWWRRESGPAITDTSSVLRVDRLWDLSLSIDIVKVSKPVVNK